MSQALDMFPIFSPALSKTISFPVWQVHASILKRLQGMKWDSSIYGFQRLKDIKWDSLIHKSKSNATVEGDSCFSVYYRTYSRKGDLKAEGFFRLESEEIFIEAFRRACTLFASLVPFQVEKFNFWKALPDNLLFLRRKRNELIPGDSCGLKCGNCLSYLFGNPYWRPDKLTKPICFVVDNASWLIRFALLSTPLVPALCMGSKNLRQAI